VVFHTKSGPLAVTRQGDEVAMDLPARPAQPVATSPAFARALGAMPAACVQARALVGVLERAEDVRAVTPDMAALVALDGVETAAVTAPGTGADADVDFVSRYFAPRKGIPEDPVTGSLHVTLVPYWAARLGKKSLRARQVSARGGEIGCVLREDGRVVLSGRAVVVMRGTLLVDSLGA
jgi:predicted PhzF superfamily epimerase YddE/YHI9